MFTGIGVAFKPFYEEKKNEKKKERKKERKKKKKVKNVYLHKKQIIKYSSSFSF